MTPNLEALRDLLVKARAAKEGSRELNEAVFRMVDPDAWETEEGSGLFESPYFDRVAMAPPAYTTRPYDLTAVVGLIKEGWFIFIGAWQSGGCTMIIKVSSHEMCVGTAPTPALALLIAVIEAWIYELESTT